MIVITNFKLTFAFLIESTKNVVITLSKGNRVNGKNLRNSSCIFLFATINYKQAKSQEAVCELLKQIFYLFKSKFYTILQHSKKTVKLSI